MNKSTELVYLDDSAHVLRISDHDLYTLIKSKNIQVTKAELGPAISKSDFLALAYSSDILPLVQKTLRFDVARRLKDKSSGADIRFGEDSAQKIIKYRAYIGTIEAIHAKYNDLINPNFQETPESAAFILMARSISYLRMAIDSLQDKHFEAIILLRPIDEAIALAEYFLIERESVMGKSNLEAWYRENHSPSNAICRESIDRYLSSKPIANLGPPIGLLMKKLYYGKSKPIHNAHHSIMETYNTTMKNDGLSGVGFDYGISSHPRKLQQLVMFYQSSIWNVAMGMMICFAALTNVLSDQDKNTLIALNRSFLGEANARGR
jgi:hypothetical protein